MIGAGSALRRFDTYQQRRRWLGFPIAVVRKFTEDQAGNLAALIAYYAFFSFFPLLLVLVTGLGFVMAGHPEVERRVLDSVLNQFPVIGDQLSYTGRRLTGNGLGLAVGIVGALWGGLKVVNAVQIAMNTVWQVAMTDRPNIAVRSLRSVVLLLVLGVGVLFTTVVNVSSAGASSYGWALGSGVRGAAIALTLAANIGLYVIAYKMLTVHELTWRDVLPGAIPAGIAWQLLQLVGGYYVASTLRGATTTYGTFAIVIGLLTWFALLGNLTVLGAELNVVRKLRLWPRSLVQPPRTEADVAAYDGYAETQRFQPDQRISVRFVPTPADTDPDGAEPTDADPDGAEPDDADRDDTDPDDADPAEAEPDDAAPVAPDSTVPAAEPDEAPQAGAGAGRSRS